jgi:hypothetical protein
VQLLGRPGQRSRITRRDEDLYLSQRELHY